MYYLPEMFVTTRWLSVYDVALSIIMFNIFVIFYLSFLSKPDKGCLSQCLIKFTLIMRMKHLTMKAIR